VPVRSTRRPIHRQQRFKKREPMKMAAIHQGCGEIGPPLTIAPENHFLILVTTGRRAIRFSRATAVSHPHACHLLEMEDLVSPCGF